MRPAILSGIVTWDVPVSYWPIFSHAPLRKLTRPRLLFVSIVTNCNLMALSICQNWSTGQTIPVIMRFHFLSKLSSQVGQILNSMHEGDGVSTKTRGKKHFSLSKWLVRLWSSRSVLTFGKRPKRECSLPFPKSLLRSHFKNNLCSQFLLSVQ